MCVQCNFIELYLVQKSFVHKVENWKNSFCHHCHQILLSKLFSRCSLRRQLLYCYLMHTLVCFFDTWWTFFPIFWHLLCWYCLAATSVKCVNFMHIRANFWISHGTSGQEIVKSTLYRFSHPSKIFLGKCYYARSRLDPQPFFCRWPQTILAFMVTTKVNTRQSWLVLDVRKKIG